MLLYFILCLCSHKHKHSKKCKSREHFIEKPDDNKYNVGRKITKVVKPKEVKSKRSKVESDRSLKDSDEYDSMPESLKKELLDTDISSSESDTKSTGKLIAKHKEESKAKKKSKSAKKSSKVGGIKSDSDSKQKGKKSSKKISKICSSNSESSESESNSDSSHEDVTSKGKRDKSSSTESSSESSESSSASVHKNIKGRKQQDKLKASKYKSKSSESDTDSKSSVGSSSDSDKSDKKRRSNAKKGIPSTKSGRGNVELSKKHIKFILHSKDNEHAIDFSDFAKKTGEIDFKAVSEVIGKNLSICIEEFFQNLDNKEKLKEIEKMVGNLFIVLRVLADNKEKVDDKTCVSLINFGECFGKVEKGPLRFLETLLNSELIKNTFNGIMRSIETDMNQESSSEPSDSSSESSDSSEGESSQKVFDLISFVRKKISDFFTQ